MRLTLSGGASRFASTPAGLFIIGTISRTDTSKSWLSGQQTYERQFFTDIPILDLQYSYFS
jgi:hypothetical protein